MLDRRIVSRCWAQSARNLHYMNAGSFGLPSLPVQKKLQDLIRSMSDNPINFFVHPERHGGLLYQAGVGLLEENRRFVAEKLGANAENFVLVPNTTTAQNAVVSSLVRCGHFKSRAGRPAEIVQTSFGYNATKNILQAAADDTGAVLKTAELPFPLESHEHAFEIIKEQINPQTRLVMIDAISSNEACILPYKKVVAFCREHDIPVFVDCAHAAGQLPLHLEELQPDFAAFSFHKWCFGAEGSGGLYVRPTWHTVIRPTAISHGANSESSSLSRFVMQFAWNGTSGDLGSLTVKTAWKTLESLSSHGVEGVVAANQSMLNEGVDLIRSRLGISAEKLMPPELRAPLMATIPLPPCRVRDLQQSLRDQNFVTQMGTGLSGGQPMIRVSAAPFNRPEQYERLAVALKREIPLFAP